MRVEALPPARNTGKQCEAELTGPLRYRSPSSGMVCSQKAKYRFSDGKCLCERHAAMRALEIVTTHDFTVTLTETLSCSPASS